MGDKTQDLKKLYDLKKKQDRMCRNQDKIEYYNEQKEQIRTQAADTTLMPLKSTDNAATLQAQLQLNNRRSREIRHITFLTIALLAMVGICVLCCLLSINNDMLILEKGGFFSALEREKPMEGTNTPKFEMICFNICLVFSLVAFLFASPKLLIPHSFYGAMARWGLALVVVTFPVILAYNLSFLFHLYGSLPFVAIILAVITRVHNAQHKAKDLGTLTFAQEIQIKEATRLDERNAQENIRIKQQAKDNSLAERQRELDRLDQQIRDVEDELYHLDQQMRSMNVLPASEFISLPRLLEFLESNQAPDLDQARKLYAKEQAELQKKADADARRSREQLSLYRLYATLNRIERDAATRRQWAQSDQNFNDVENEKAYLKKLENIRDKQLQN